MTREFRTTAECWPAGAPFRISGRCWTEFDLLVCEIAEGGNRGRGEAAGVFYTGETIGSMQAQVEQLGPDLRNGLDREALLHALPPGGARNAVDCALWDLEARRSGRSVWDLAGVTRGDVSTVFTIGLEDSPEAMAAKARAAIGRPQLKVKLDSDRPVQRIQAIRDARPDAELVIDVNGDWTFPQLVECAPAMAELGVLHIEQPLPRGGDAELAGYRRPLPILADESCLHCDELPGIADRYDGIVIKLDKAGGLTAAMQLADAAEDLGLKLMVGCMVATSLSMAPAHVLAQRCSVVDIDGPLLLAQDRPGGLRYVGNRVSAPAHGIWGG